MLTAEEVSALDLSGTEWAVLSACETGVGKVLPGEGVLGLRRAFAVAGAGTLIMSLWQVDDAATRHWMKALYEGRLGGRSTADAVREASLSMISRQRARGRTTHPFFWGGFVAEGDWR
jgi:CHAT domain-containing protein